MRHEIMPEFDKEAIMAEVDRAMDEGEALDVEAEEATEAFKELSKALLVGDGPEPEHHKLRIEDKETFFRTKEQYEEFDGWRLGFFGAQEADNEMRAGLYYYLDTNGNVIAHGNRAIIENVPVDELSVNNFSAEQGGSSRIYIIDKNQVGRAAERLFS